jgi:hypothetical protein
MRPRVHGRAGSSGCRIVKLRLRSCILPGGMAPVSDMPTPGPPPLGPLPLGLLTLGPMPPPVPPGASSRASWSHGGQAARRRSHGQAADSRRSGPWWPWRTLGKPPVPTMGTVALRPGNTWRWRHRCNGEGQPGVRGPQDITVRLQSRALYLGHDLVQEGVDGTLASAR